MHRVARLTSPLPKSEALRNLGLGDLPATVREALVSLAHEFQQEDLHLILFGSFAEGRAWPTSDLDIAYSGSHCRETELRLMRRIEDLPTVRPVDLVPLATATPALIAEVQRTGIPLSEL